MSPILNIKESRDLQVSVDIPENAEFGNYTGTLNLVMKRTNQKIF